MDNRNKILKISLNILIFLLIAGFGYYMVHSIMSDEKFPLSNDESGENSFISPYKKTDSFNTTSNILCFDVYENEIYAVLYNKISIFDLSGKYLRDFEIEPDARDIAVETQYIASIPTTTIYLLYPNRIDIYSSDGQKTGGWEACSNNSDYCSFTTTKEYVFVTDAENKNLVQYNKEGGLVRFIKSPDGFVIPSYSFGIININDTIYCSNSGRHKIESYTLDGKFIASFGESGAGAGAFAGCCNPVYLAKNPNGHILTSEKGNPRISCYSRDGKFRTILFDAKVLGGGTDAYKICVSGENIYIANRKTISVYGFDSNLSKKSCVGCEEECSLRISIEKYN